MSDNNSKLINEQLRECKGKWVALSKDETEILGVGDTMHSVVVQAHHKGTSQPLVIKIPTTEARTYFF